METMNCEVVENTAMGKAFVYCRTHKVEHKECLAKTETIPVAVTAIGALADLEGLYGQAQYHPWYNSASHTNFTSAMQAAIDAAQPKFGVGQLVIVDLPGHSCNAYISRISEVIPFGHGHLYRLEGIDTTFSERAVRKYLG